MFSLSLVAIGRVGGEVLVKKPLEDRWARANMTTVLNAACRKRQLEEGQLEATGERNNKDKDTLTWLRVLLH